MYLPADLITAAILAAATFASEDLASIAAGVMVAEGRIGFLAAALGCFAGIFTGDLLLFWAGRAFGSSARQTRIVTRLVSDDSVRRSAEWIRRRGAVVVFLSRFLPGTRVATYVAAGALGLNPRLFAAWLAAAAALWTPLLVAASSVLGGALAEAALLRGRDLVVRGGVAVAGTLLAVRLVRLGLEWRTRRQLIGAWRRWTRWEFWPPWIFYPPVVVYIAILAIKYRSITVFAAANPGIPGGGFIGESKFDILRSLPARDTARFARVPGDTPLETRLARVEQFMSQASVPFPVVLKPDMGQRGSGVVIVKTPEDLRQYLATSPVDLIIQEYVAGEEFGVFYYRLPDEDVGAIFSITEKRFPTVVGDGRRTVDELILADDRAVCLAAVYRRAQRHRLATVPAAGECVRLVEIGSHCRGSVFFDATEIVTPELVAAFDRIAKAFDGFYFGRFDVRTASVDDFRRGTNFRILELNGVTSEATHIYDPATSVLAAWRVLCRQWRLAFEIGARNRQRGTGPTNLVTLLSLTRSYRRTAGLHPGV